MRLPTKSIALAACASVLVSGGAMAQRHKIMGLNQELQMSVNNNKGAARGKGTTERELVDKLQTMKRHNPNCTDYCGTPNQGHFTRPKPGNNAQNKPLLGQYFRMGSPR